jgi:hypothetical protein
MITKYDLIPISIRGRVAFGITCLEKLLNKWGVENNKITELLHVLWTFTSSTALDIWERDILSVLPEDDSVESIHFGFGSLTEEQREDLSDLIYYVIEIGRGNLYGGYVSDFTSEPTIKVIEIVMKNEVKTPELHKFKKSSAQEGHGWGTPVEPEYFR